MALSPEDIKSRYPLPVYNYKVEINGEVIAFSEVTGLSKSFETSTYKESKTDQPGSGPVFMYMPGQIKPITITLKKGYVRTKNLPVFYNWINGTRINQIEKKDIKVRLTDEEGNAVVSWSVVNAFPTKLDAPAFDAKSNDVAIESLELMADNLFMEES